MLPSAASSGQKSAPGKVLKLKKQMIESGSALGQAQSRFKKQIKAAGTNVMTPLAFVDLGGGSSAHQEAARGHSEP